MPNMKNEKEMNNMRNIRKGLSLFTYVPAASHFSYKSGTSSLKRLINLVVNVAGTLRRGKKNEGEKRKIEETDNLHNPK